MGARLPVGREGNRGAAEAAERHLQGSPGECRESIEANHKTGFRYGPCQVENVVGDATVDREYCFGILPGDDLICRPDLFNGCFFVTLRGLFASDMM